MDGFLSRGDTGSDLSIRAILLGPCGDVLELGWGVARMETRRPGRKLVLKEV